MNSLIRQPNNTHQYIMNKSINTVYASPKVDVVDLTAESVLCASTENGNQNYGYGNSDNWF